MAAPRVLVNGFAFAQGPRWHEGRLWFCDFYTHRVQSVDEAGALLCSRTSTAAIPTASRSTPKAPSGSRIPNRRVVRVREGGAIARQIDLAPRRLACALGGPDRRTLFILTNTSSGAQMTDKRDGRIETIRVDVPGAGRP
jgi:sugar lactone lactonase YvrE